MSVATSYAKALFEVVGKDTAKAESIEMALKTTAESMKASREIRAMMTAPIFNITERSKLFKALADKVNAGKVFEDFLLLLSRKRRVGQIGNIASEFKRVRIESEGGILGRVVSADPVKAEDLEALAKSFGQKLGKKVAFDTSVDSTLLAGMSVTVNGVTYDGSLKTQLARLKEQLVHGSAMTH